MSAALLQPVDHARLDVGDSLVGGAGWIAIALVIFAFWRAELCLVGAYFFGGLLRSRSRSRLTESGDTGIPQGATVRDDDRRARARLDGLRAGAAWAPAALGVPYVREER